MCTISFIMIYFLHFSKSLIGSSKYFVAINDTIGESVINISGDQVGKFLPFTTMMINPISGL